MPCALAPPVLLFQPLAGPWGGCGNCGRQLPMEHGVASRCDRSVADDAAAHADAAWVAQVISIESLSGLRRSAMVTAGALRHSQCLVAGTTWLDSVQLERCVPACDPCQLPQRPGCYFSKIARNAVRERAVIFGSVSPEALRISSSKCLSLAVVGVPKTSSTRS